jgi:hypothetical protein
MDEDGLAELWNQVLRIILAKRGEVVFRLPSSPEEYRITTVDKIPAEHAEDFWSELNFYAYGGMGLPYVIPETERVKAFLAEHGEYFG